MVQKKYTEEQIIAVLTEAEAGPCRSFNSPGRLNWACLHNGLGL
jgi:hypothetical protein